MYNNIVFLGILSCLLAGLATNIGTLPTIFSKKISNKILDISLGTAAGVMLAATSFSLIIPAIESGGGGAKGALLTVIGILFGSIFLDVVDRFLPNSNLLINSMDDSQNEERIARLRRAKLFILAITIHNFPEGLAVGVGFGDGNIANGISLAIAIGLQNIPEGLAVVLPLLREGIAKWKAYLVVLATGLVEPIGGLIGVFIIQVARPIMPLCLAFAAGAMLFVICNEIIPETQNNEKYAKLATHALIVGFVVMMFLDNVLG